MSKNTDIRQIPLTFAPQPFLGKEDFMVSSCNAEAFSYVESWPDWPFFAVCLYGPAGCGKTMSYVFPLIDIISSNNSDKDSRGKNILIVTPDSAQSVKVSDRLAVFNKYHEINGAAVKEGEENIADEANVIIGAPDLLIDVVDNDKVDLSKVDILVVDDINLIKKNKQLENLEKILALLPSEKQNIVYTNRRSKETQDILSKILKAPEEIKIDKTKEQEVDNSAKSAEAENKTKFSNMSIIDDEAVALASKLKSFGGKVPQFILTKGIIAEGEEK